MSEDDVVRSMQKEWEKIIQTDPGRVALLLGSEDNPYGLPMYQLASIMLVYHLAKDEQYGRSWSKHGETGIYHNVMRKDDRLEKLSVLAMLGEDAQQYRVALIDTLIDYALYAMMWVSNMSKNHPEAFKEWMTEYWSRVTGISAEAAQQLSKSMDEYYAYDYSLGDE